VFAVPAPRFLILANPPDFRAMREVGVEIGLLVFGMTQARGKLSWNDINTAIRAFNGRAAS
jgi:hypothetical protein